MSKYTFRNVDPSDKSAFLDLVGSVWGESTRARQEQLWDWWRMRDRAIPDPRHHSLVAEKDGVLVGYGAALPVRLQVAGRERSGCYAFDAVTSAAHRGLGIHLFRRQMEATEAMLGAAEPRARQLWTKLYGRDVDIKDMSKRILVLDPAPFLRRRGVPGPAASIVAFAWKAALAWRARRAVRRPSPSLRVERVDRFPEDVDAFCREFQRQFPNIAIRDRAYLDWRFCDCPFAYERTILRDGGRMVGYAVHRIARMNGRRILLLVEALAVGDRLANYLLLLDQARRTAIDGGASDIQTMDTGCPDFHAALGRFGFVHRPDMPAIGKIDDDRTDESPMYRKEDWFLTMGDSDFEFAYFPERVGDGHEGGPSGESASGALAARGVPA